MTKSHFEKRPSPSPIITIETRISNTEANAAAIARLLEAELAERIVYCHRARLLIGLAGDAAAVMDRAEAAGVANDFTDAWRDLRERLSRAKRQFEQILAGSEASQQPCQPHA